MATEAPKFRVVQAPGFAAGTHFFQPGEEIVWEEPKDWDEAAHGRHFASYGPSITFEPLNRAAETMLEAQRARVARALQPKATEEAKAEQRHARLEEMFAALIAVMTENAKKQK